jgi:hypothetical protein
VVSNLLRDWKWSIASFQLKKRHSGASGYYCGQVTIGKSVTPDQFMKTSGYDVIKRPKSPIHRSADD